MNDVDLKSIRRALLLQKSRILNKASEFRNSEMREIDRSPDEGDKIANELSLGVSLHLQERDRSALMQIERALCKIQDGTYGQCEGCSDWIASRRLRARPFASLCITCMEEQEEFHSPVN